MKKKKKKLPCYQWFEIEEWIPPANARANVGVWARVYTKALKPYHEQDAKKARDKLSEIPKGRKFRLVLVTRQVVKEKE